MDLDPVGEQRFATLVGAGQLGAVAGERAGDVRPRHPDCPGSGELVVEEHPPPTFIPSASSAFLSLSVPVSWAPPQLRGPVMSAPGS